MNVLQEATKLLYKLPGQESNFLLQGGDSFGTGDDDVADAGADDDYVADITAAREAWDPRPTQDWGLF